MNLARRQLLIGLALLGTAGTGRLFAYAPRRTKHTAPDLATLIPTQFGSWQESDSLRPMAPDPVLQAKLDELYAQTLARTYVDANGSLVMLSVAYGANQSDERLQIHRPEYCYQAQGFAVSTVADEQLTMAHGELPVRRLLALRDGRPEPITYWLTVETQAVLPGVARKFAQLRLALAGIRADGLLVRISSINHDSARAFTIQDGFIRDLAGALDSSHRLQLFGDIRARGT